MRTRPLGQVGLDSVDSDPVADSVVRRAGNDLAVKVPVASDLEAKALVANDLVVVAAEDLEVALAEWIIRRR